MRLGWQDPNDPGAGGSDGETSRRALAVAVTIIVVLSAVLGAFAWRSLGTPAPEQQVVTSSSTAGPGGAALSFAYLPVVTQGQAAQSGSCQWGTSGGSFTCTPSGTGNYTVTATVTATRRANATLSYVTAGNATATCGLALPGQAELRSGSRVQFPQGTTRLVCQVAEPARERSALEAALSG